MKKPLDVAAVADALGISRRVVLAHIREGRLRAFNAGRGSIRPDYRIWEDDLTKFVENQMVFVPAKKPPRRSSPVSRPVIEYI